MYSFFFIFFFFPLCLFHFLYSSIYGVCVCAWTKTKWKFHPVCECLLFSSSLLYLFIQIDWHDTIWSITCTQLLLLFFSPLSISFVIVDCFKFEKYKTWAHEEIGKGIKMWTKIEKKIQNGNTKKILFTESTDGCAWWWCVACILNKTVSVWFYFLSHCLPFLLSLFSFFSAWFFIYYCMFIHYH